MPRPELELTLSKLKNPRMSAGLMVLYSLLAGLKGPVVPPREVRERTEVWTGGRPPSKQSISNAARRLDEAGLVERTEGYSVKYGYLIAVLLDSLLDLSDRVAELEEELASMRSKMRTPVEA